LLFFIILFLFFPIFFVILISYEDGVQFNLLKKLLCKFGLHKLKVKFGKLKINKYYCQYCKKPRKRPKLTMIDGSNKWYKNNYKF